MLQQHVGVKEENRDPVSDLFDRLSRLGGKATR